MCHVPDATEIVPYSVGYYVIASDGMHLFDKNGQPGEIVKIPDALKGNKTGMWDGPKSVWAGNSDGLGNYDISAATPTVLADRFKIEGTAIGNVVYATDSPDGSEVWFNAIGWNGYLPGSENYGEPYVLESYNWETGELGSHHPLVEKQQHPELEKLGPGPLYGGPSRTLFDPVDPTIFYNANNSCGLEVMRDGELLYNYNGENSPIQSNWRWRTDEMAFDLQGNLWLVVFTYDAPDRSGNKTIMKMLTKEGLDLIRKGEYEKVTEFKDGKFTYWQTSDRYPVTRGCHVGRLVFSSKSGKGLQTGTAWGVPVVGIDTKGTTRMADDSYQQYTGFMDQDGNAIVPTNIYCVEEDRNGKIWIGTILGPLVINDVDQLADGSSDYINVIRPKVARNDGTQYADYLLSSEVVYCIATDANNNKWICTENSGLYFVSPDGTEILDHFTTDNSPLLTNQISMAHPNPNGNDVLVGTPEGLFVYSSTSAPAADDYSSVYAYPNPVRPDYSGWITITGLMDNSLIKITDPQGSVVWNGRSEGGIAMWDGCDAAGNRVRSGVYMVFVSSSADGSSKGAVAKIAVIN